jgi:hypothetical protein
VDLAEANSSQIEVEAASSQKMLLIIDFDDFFYKAGAPFSVKEIAHFLVELLKFFEIIFLVNNEEKAKKLLTDKYDYPEKLTSANDVKFMSCKSNDEKKQHLVLLLSIKLQIFYASLVCTLRL